MQSRLALLTSAALIGAALVPLAQAGSTRSVRVRPLTITTTVPAAGALGTTTCVVDADLYTPAGVDARHPAPALLTTNGYGGSKTTNASLARGFAARGYVVLA